MRRFPIFSSELIHGLTEKGLFKQTDEGGNVLNISATKSIQIEIQNLPHASNDVHCT